MEQLSDELLQESYAMAIQLDLDADFISLIRCEIDKRGLKRVLIEK